MNLKLEDQQAALYAQLARLGEAMSSPHRLKIISLLSQSAKTVEQLAGLIKQSKATTSAHLKVLEHSGLVNKTKHGRYVWCRLASESTTRLWLQLRALGEELIPQTRAIIDTHFSDEESLSSLTPETLHQKLDSDAVTLLDLRPLDEYEAGHLPQAQHFPFADLTEQLPTLSTELPTLVYCRGPYCLQALRGTQTIRARGIAAQQLPFGAPEWAASGLRLEKEPSQS
jgi:rhodanese-related sulfurtransferase/DNA-binding transcriptional ArsR family regulator